MKRESPRGGYSPTPEQCPIYFMAMNRTVDQLGPNGFWQSQKPHWAEKQCVMEIIFKPRVT